LSLNAQIDKRDLKKLDNIFKKLSPSQRGNAVFKGMQVAGIFLEGQLKQYDKFSTLGKITGRLQNSIQSKVENKSSGDIFAIIGSGVRDGGRVKYANVHEEGYGNIPARYYMSKTLKSNEKRAIDLLFNTIISEVKKVS
jgi:hypothetical protein